MKTINVTEFRTNLKRYLDLAQKERLIIHRGKGSSFVIIPLEEVNEGDFFYKSVEKRQLKARKEKLEGTLKTIDPDNLWESIGLQ